MVWTLAGYGERLGEVGGFVFHRFPTVERLAQVSEQELREAGFGYRRRVMPRQAQICDCLRLGLVHLGLGLVLCWISTIGVGWVGSAPPGRSCSGA
ncbi:N-glycosylase/DNA lyase [Hordeum vulgare]|nr:N-glycosylase/DNA lyase [Hordeum vulgare]